MITLFFKLLIAHAVGDFGLQNDFIANFKSRHSKFFTGEIIWPYVLGAHSLIHGGIVFIITHNPYLAFLETMLHGLIDYLKCEKLFGFHVDQFLHVLCKFLWAYLAVRGVL